jgi:hypothetical protein
MAENLTFDPYAAVNLHFRRARNATKKFVFTQNGSAYDLSSTTLQLNVRTSSGQTTNILQRISGNGLTIGGAGNNELTVSFSEIHTDLAPRIYYWELYNATNKTTWLAGQFTIYVGVVDPIDTSLSITINTDPSVVNVDISDCCYSDVDVEPNTITTDYTLALTDAWGTVELNSATDKTVTVPPNSSVVFKKGVQIKLAQYGAGQIIVAPGAGVTIRSPEGLLTTRVQYSQAALEKRDTNEWYLNGDLI